MNHPKSDADGGGTKGTNASRAALSAHTKTQFCAYARASLRHRTLNFDRAGVGHLSRDADTPNFYAHLALLEFESRYPVLWARERRVSIKTLGLVCVTLSPFSSSI